MLRFIDLETPEPQENDELTRLPNFEQGPSQGPNTPVRWYPQEEKNKGFFGPDKADLDPAVVTSV